MASKQFHPLLQTFRDSLSGLDDNSKASDFRFALESKATGIWTKDKLNQLLPLCPADQIPFVANNQRKDKISAVCGWIDSIFSKNDQYVQPVVQLEFSALDMKRAVDEALQKQKSELAKLDQIRMIRLLN